MARLLDKPIHKTAISDENKAALLKLILGGTVGTGMGMLGESIFTGKPSWRGAVTGLGLGLGATAAADKPMRDRIIAAYRGLGRKEEPAGEAGEQAAEAGAQAPEGAEQELTPRQILEHLDTVAASPDITDEQKAEVLKTREALDDLVYGGPRALNALDKDPKYAESLDFVREQGPEMLDAAGMYANWHMKEKGRPPSPMNLEHFVASARDLPPSEWEKFAAGSHELSGEEKGLAKQIVPQIVAGSIGARIMPPAAAALAKTPRGMKILQLLAGKGSLPAGITGTEGQGFFTFMKRVFGKTPKGVGYGAALPSKGAGKAAATKGMIGLDFIFDAFELGLDPVTGKYNPNIARNISRMDKLMEAREKHGTMLTGLLPKGVISDPALRKKMSERNPLYNIGAGMMRGRFNPMTNIGIAGKRIKDISGLGQANMLRTVQNQQGLKNKLMAAAKRGIKNAQVGSSAFAEVGKEIAALTDYKKRDTAVDWGQGEAAPTLAELNAFRAQRGLPAVTRLPGKTR